MKYTLRSKKNYKKRSKKKSLKRSKLLGGAAKYEYIIFHLYPIKLNYDNKKFTTINYSTKQTSIFPFYVTQNEESEQEEKSNTLKSFFMYCFNYINSGQLRYNKQIPHEKITFFLDKNEIYVHYEKNQVKIGYIDMIKTVIFPWEKVYYNDEHTSIDDYYLPTRQQVPIQPYGGSSRRKKRGGTIQGGTIISMEFIEIDAYNMIYPDDKVDFSNLNNNVPHYINTLAYKLMDYKYYIYFA